MIEFDQVQYFYPDSTAPALDGVCLGIPPGQTYLLTGRSGSGKSTALRAAAGLVPRFYGGRFSGRIRVAGVDTRTHPTRQLAGVVGLVFQEPEARFLTRFAEDEIAFGLELAGWSGSEIRIRMARIVERLEVGGLLGRRLAALSAGEQQRVAIAASLGREPSIVLMDEPTSQLDGPSATEVVSWVHAVCAEAGLTALITESRIGRWSEAAGRMGHLEAGRMVGEGGPEEVATRLPVAPPLAQAAHALGLQHWVGAEAQAAIAARLVRHNGQGASPALRTKPCLRAEGITVRFDGVRALDAAGLEASPGEMVALVGRNGSGKTTLLRSIIGLIAPQSGTVELDGRSLRDQPVAERARRIGYVPQWPAGLLFAPNLREELWITLRNLGREGRPPFDPEELLTRFGLLDVAERYPRDLSAGQRQRAALAAILVGGPDVLLLDEPTLGMDPVAQGELGRLLRDLQAAGTAIVVATHDVEFVAQHAQRCVVLEASRVAAQGPTAETLFSRPETRTALQRLTGRPWPATAADLEPVA